MITIRQKNNELLLSLDNKNIAKLKYNDSDNETTITYIFVEPEYRLKGYGLRLLNRLESISKNNIIKCICNKETDNSLIIFLSKYFDKIYNDKNSNDIIFTLKRCKVDLHIHLGQIPSASKSNSNEFISTVESVYNYITKSHITHACILYTNYNQLEELSKLLPDVKLYGLQYYDISLENTLFNYQTIESDKPLWKGLKIHSHRNFSTNSIISYSTKGILSNLFKKLPEGSIVLPHFQGSLGSHPLDMLNNMVHFNHLKFIIGHSGNYGHMSYKPNIIENQYDFNKKELFKLFLISINSITDSVILANELPNVYLDSSVFAVHKNIIFNNTEHSGFGSDFPLGIMKKDKILSDQEILYCNHFNSNIHLNEIHERTVQFLDKPVEQYMKEFYERNKK